MDRPLRALIVEDSQDDALLLVQELERGGYEPQFERVESPQAMREALVKQAWDIVFADYTMPHFKGTDALELLNKAGLDMPFIFVSGTIGEDTAVSAMKAGAHDYIIKGNLKRLVPAVDRELREAEVRRERRQLQEERDRLFEETKKRAEELERANRVKSEFLSIISHELKTPINVVVGYAGMIREKLWVDQDKALGKIVKYSNELLTMIDSILNATMMEAGEISLVSEEVHLQNFISDLKSVYDFPLDKEVTLVWDYPPDLPAIKTDSVKLKHVVQNLINNAIKFTEKGNVTISVRHSPETKTVEFRVADTGIGISEENMPMIFEMFRQLDSSIKRAYGGVGLGLYIVKTFVQTLGGKIDVESEPGKGSTFTVTIPCEI